MASRLVTVLLPTFDHVETLRCSIPSVLAQTHADFELLVIGDGSPEASREIVEEFAANDPRVRWIGFEKGPRNGEAHRHGVLLQQARGDIVFYCGDDDLWLPWHVETMLETFDETGANFVSCQPCWIMPDGQPAHRWVVDLAHPWYRTELLDGRNRVPLNCGAHTMALYRALPHGWRTTPQGTPTDLYMWQQLLAHPDCRAASTPWTSVIGVPNSERGGVSIDARMDELGAWTSTTDRNVQLRFLRAAQAGTAGLLDQAAFEAEYNIALGVRDGLVGERDRLRQALEESEHRREAAEQHLQIVLNSRGWQVLERLRAMRRKLSRA